MQPLESALLQLGMLNSSAGAQQLLQRFRERAEQNGILHEDIAALQDNFIQQCIAIMALRRAQPFARGDVDAPADLLPRHGYGYVAVKDQPDFPRYVAERAMANIPPLRLPLPPIAGLQDGDVVEDLVLGE